MGPSIQQALAASILPAALMAVEPVISPFRGKKEAELAKAAYPRSNVEKQRRWLMRNRALGDIGSASPESVQEIYRRFQANDRKVKKLSLHQRGAPEKYMWKQKQRFPRQQAFLGREEAAEAGKRQLRILKVGIPAAALLGLGAYGVHRYRKAKKAFASHAHHFLPPLAAGLGPGLSTSQRRKKKAARRAKESAGHVHSF